MHRIYSMPFAKVYWLYLAKVERKGHTRTELDAVIMWLTGFDAAELQHQIESEKTFTEFFDDAVLPEASEKVTGVICGVRIEDIEDPLLKKIRILDRVVDEVAKGRPFEKVTRQFK
jgi:hypothetical protein